MLIFEGIYLNIEPGWYPDPDGKPSDRYWDGSSWTDQTRPQVSKIQQNNPAPSASPKSQKKSIGCFGWAGIVFAVLIVIAVAFPSSENEDSNRDNSQNSQAEDTPLPEIKLQDWVEGNQVGEKFERLSDLGFLASDYANDLNLDGVAVTLDAMAAIGYEMLALPSSPDSTFNEYWRSIYMDLISLEEITPGIRNLNPDAFPESMLIMERITITAELMTDYVISQSN